MRAGPGHRASQRDVHDLADGLALHRLLGQYQSLLCIASHSLPVTLIYSPLLQSVWSEKAPFLITGLLSLLGAVPGLFLPETAGLELPATLADAATFCTRDSFFWLPVMRNTPRQTCQRCFTSPWHIH